MKKLWKPALLLAAIAVMVIGLLGSGAWFTDTATSAATELSSGKLSIDDAKLNTLTIGQITNMAPGDVTGPVEIIIENNGTIDLGWFGDLQIGSSVLRNVIYIDLAKMEFLSPNGTAWEPVDMFITDGKGSGTWPTTWGGPENYATLAAFDGSDSMAPGSGYEFMGALKPGYKYKLTLTFGMYPRAGNEYQGAGPLNIDFRVLATQIKAGALDGVYSNGHNHVTWMDQQIAKQTMP